MSDATPAWMKGQGRRRGAKADGSGWWVRVLIVLALLGGAIGTLVGFLRWRDPFPRPRFLALVIGEYQSAVPPRPFGAQDAEALGELDWVAKNNARNSQEKRLLLAELDKLAQADTPVVVYVGGYVVFARAGAEGDEAGEAVPYLLPSDAAPGDRSTWVPLDSILGAMRSCPAKHKLLLLDVMQPLVWPARGMLRSDVAEGVWPLLEKSAGGGLLILTACSPGQVSHPAGELGHSAFAFFLQQGLAGKADGDGDTHISARELADHVTGGVDRWVNAHRGERQTPKLLGDAGDFFLTIQKAGAKAPAGLPAAYPPELVEGWRKHDAWWQGGIDARRRPVFLALGRVLLEEDARWRSGRAADPVFADAVGRLTRRYLELAPPEPGEETTFAEVAARAPLPATDAEDRRGLERAVAARVKLVADNKVNEETLKPIVAETDRLAKAYKGRPAALAKLVFEVAEASPLAPEAAALLSKLLAETKGLEYLAEVRYLTLLAQRGPSRRWSPEVARLAVETSLRAAEARAAAEGVGALPADLEGRRRRADQLLADGAEPWDGPARALLRKLPDEYRRARLTFDAVRQAREAVDDAFCLLPSYPLSPEMRMPDIAAGRQVLRKARQLRTLLAAPDRGDRGDEIRPLEAALRSGPDSLNSLLAPLQEDGFPRLIDATRAGKKAETQTCRLLLATPWPTADQRPALWAAFRDGASRTPAPGPGALPSWDAAAVKKAKGERRQRDLERAAGIVLSLAARSEDPAALEQAMAGLESKPTATTAWDKLAAAVRAGWVEDR